MDNFCVNSSVLSEPQIPKSLKLETMSTSNIIMEPTLIGALPPKQKKAKLSQNEDERQQILKQQHSYLITVRNEHLQHLTSIILQLSKSSDLFHSICKKTVTVPRASLLSLAKKLSNIVVG